jgi:predicted porin
MLNKHKSNGACFGLCLAGSLLWNRSAAAEVKLIDKDGWTFTFDGRVDAFLSVGKGDDFPSPTVDPNGGMHTVMGTQGEPSGLPDVGWRSSTQSDENNKYFAMRVRSGMFPNILGFGLQKKLGETTTIKGYISIWSTVETLGRDKFHPLTAEAREGYFTVDAPWGNVTAGRTLGWLGRTSYEIDVMYGHGYGVGMPCADSVGPTCGHIGTGVLFPGYSAGVSYSTPSLAGLQLHAGVYDPIVFSTSTGDWARAPFPRPEGSITYATPLGNTGSLKLGVEGLWQLIRRTTTDATTMAQGEVDTSVWGVSGGARVELGPVRLGASGFHGRGIGLGYAAQRSAATSDNDSSTTPPGGLTYELRTFSGYYAQAAVILGDLHIAAGYGQGIVDQLDADKRNPLLSVIHTQTGISGAVYYHLSDSVVLGLDYFHYEASWYGAPIVDANMQPTGSKLTGEKQTLDFFNAGVTYHW